LVLGHPSDVVVLETNLLVESLDGVEAEELRELAAVLRVLVNAEFDVHAEGLLERLEVAFVFGKLGEKVHALLDDVLANAFRISREMLSGRSSESESTMPAPLTKLRYLGMRSLAQSSMMERW
jgi:hypothetical protein